MSNINWRKIKSYDDIIFEFFEGIAKITINRPSVGNSFRPETVQSIIEAIEICKEKKNIDVIVITGSGKKYFCSGGDQNLKVPGGYLDKKKIPRLNFLELQKKIREITKPIIAMVNGYAIGGGNVLQIICDLTIASKNAIFGQTGPRVGSFDGGFGASYLAKIVGQKKTREIWFLCKKYSAKEAMNMGLINKIVSQEKLENSTIKWCRIIQSMSPISIRMIKRCLNAELDGQRGLMELAGDATMMFYFTKESKEGKNAFLEKRDPNFKKFPKFP